MPTYEITAPDGRVLEITGDTPPTEQELDNIFAETSTTQPIKAGVKKTTFDIRPSRLVKAVPKALASPIIAKRKNVGLKEAYNMADEAYKRLEQEHPFLVGGVPALVDFGAYSAIPGANIIKGARGAAGLGKFINAVGRGTQQGAAIGSIESLAGQGDLSGAKPGGAIGGTIAAGIEATPYVGRVAKLVPGTRNIIANTVGRIKPETLQRAVQANSKALDLNEKQAQNLLMNTTEDVRNAYNNILAKRGKEVGEAVENLKQGEYTPINIDDVKNDVTSAYNQYQLDKINPARELSGELEENLLNLVEKARITPDNTVSPTSLQGLKTTVGRTRKNLWKDEKANEYGNPILKEVYRKWADRLSELSPELAQANKRFADVAKFEENEGLMRILRRGNKLDDASKALRSYNSTITSGNKSRNVQDLENMLVNEGYDPFLNNIDDVNAAMDLLNVRSTGDSWLANLATQLTRPTLKLQRGLNRRFGNIQNLGNVGRKAPQYLTPAAVQMAPLQGYLEYNEQY